MLLYLKSNVSEVLNVHMNGIHKNITTIKYNKLKFVKVLKKSHFLSQKLIFHCRGKKILLKKLDILIIFVHMNVQNFQNIEIDDSVKTNFRQF